FADTLITPISDSLIDLSVMSDIDFVQNKIKGPGPYAEFIWNTKKYLAGRGKPYLNWIVVGNKAATINSKNKNIVFNYLENIAKLYGFRFLSGLKDRVIYKELFLEGLTVLDMSHEKLKMKMSMSHLAARREIKNLAEFICPEE
ncbi:MAG: ATPase, partial [Alphaproteobacteria bacterium]|nr:ATPase [Alphaproteobacteria bacterium]